MFVVLVLQKNLSDIVSSDTDLENFGIRICDFGIN